MKISKRKLKTKAPNYGEYYDPSKHLVPGAIIHNAIASGLGNAPGARGRLPVAALMLH